MYVCICNGVTERTVRQAAADGVRSLSELTRRTGGPEPAAAARISPNRFLRDEHHNRVAAFALPLFVAA